MATRTADRGYAATPADLPRGTLVQLLFEAADRYRKPDALRNKHAGEWHDVSHADLLDAVRFLALALEERGIRRGDHVALLSENRPEWAIADFAALCLGAPDVPIYPSLPPEQVAFVLDDSGARVAFVSTADQLAKIREVRGALPDLETVIIFDDIDIGAGGDGAITIREALERGRERADDGAGADFRERALAAEPDDVATVLYTSGTTGTPKGVMLTHNNIYSNTRAVEDVLPIGPDDSALSMLPLSHIFERMVDYFLFSKGCTLAYAESFKTVPEDLVAVRPTIVASVPRLYEKIYAKVQAATGLKGALVAWASRVGERRADALLAGREPTTGTRLRYALADRLVFGKLREKTGGRVRYFISGGAPLSAEVAKFFYSAGLLILEGYGLTETSPVTNVNTPEQFRFGTVGKPAPGTEERIGEDGEILVRGPQVMKGYFKRPDATREAIDADGWFHTGDIGELDADGFLRVTDRKKELIVTAGGKNIAPQPIENRVKMCRFVDEAVLMGDRRPYLVLLIVPDFEVLGGWAAENGLETGDRAALAAERRVQEKVEAEIFGACAEFARYETPKKIALIPRELTIERGELTPTLKVRRRVIEDHYGAVLDTLYDGAERAVAEPS